jgi:hypothetical protein
VVSAVTARNNININMGWEYFLIGIGILGCIFLAVCKFLFSKDNEKDKEEDVEIQQLYAQIGKLQVQNEFLKKKL